MFRPQTPVAATLRAAVSERRLPFVALMVTWTRAWPQLLIDPRCACIPTVSEVVAGLFSSSKSQVHDIHESRGFCMLDLTWPYDSKRTGVERANGECNGLGCCDMYAVHIPHEV